MRPVPKLNRSHNCRQGKILFAAALLVLTSVGYLLWLTASLGAVAAGDPPTHASRSFDRAAPLRVRWSPRVAAKRTEIGAVEPVEMMGGPDFVDRCEPRPPVAAPAEFHKASRHGLTVYWPDATLSPEEADVLLMGMTLAVAEAAELVRAPRLAGIGAVVYPSRDDFLTAVRAPTWAGGAYDGLIRLYRGGRGELPRLRTLRHEAMHAVLDMEVGCTPVWLNEGLAQYVSGSFASARRIWLDIVRDRIDVPIHLVSGDRRALTTVGPAEARLLYAQSLAMVMMVIAYEGPAGIARALRLLKGGQPTERLWGALQVGGANELRAFMHRLAGSRGNHVATDPATR